MHDTVGCYIDLSNGHVFFSKNGSSVIVQYFETKKHAANDHHETLCLVSLKKITISFLKIRE